MISAAIFAASKVAETGMQMWNAASAIKNQKKLYKAQKKLIGEKRKTTEMRAEYNEKEIMSAFEENYKRTAFAYGEKIRDVISKKGDVASDITAKAAANLSNVEMSGSSFHNSQMMELNTEFEAATSTLIYNQSQAMTDLAAKKNSDLTNNRLGVIEANKAYSMEEWQIKNDRDSAIKYQTGKLIQGIAPLYKSAKGFQGEYDAAKESGKGFGDLFKSALGGGK